MNLNVLIYYEKQPSAKLIFVLDFVFLESLSFTDYKITDDEYFFENYIGIKLSYHPTPLKSEINLYSSVFFENHFSKFAIVFDKIEIPKKENVFEENTRLDCFESIFKILNISPVLFTRKVETKDNLIIDKWVRQIENKIKSKYPRYTPKNTIVEAPKYLNIYVDQLFFYKYQNFYTNLEKIVSQVYNLEFRDFFRNIRTKINISKDPSLQILEDYILQLKEIGVECRFFFSFYRYFKNSRFYNTLNSNTLYFYKDIADKYNIGLTIAKEAATNREHLKREIENFEKIFHKEPTKIALSDKHSLNDFLKNYTRSINYLNSIEIFGSHVLLEPNFYTAEIFHYFYNEKDISSKIKLIPSLANLYNSKDKQDSVQNIYSIEQSFENLKQISIDVEYSLLTNENYLSQIEKHINLKSTIDMLK